jgi:hypothetical protein
MRIETIEGARRLQFGLKGAVGSIGTKGVMPIVAEGNDWKGARAEIRTDEYGNRSTQVLPQIGAKRTSSDTWEWCPVHGLTIASVERYPKGSQFQIIGGRDEAENERLVEKLRKFCPAFVYGGKLMPPFSADGKVMLAIEHQLEARAGGRDFRTVRWNCN